MDKESDIATIKDVLKQYAKGCNTGDFDFWISFWADDGVQMPPDALARVGKEQIREHMKSVARAQSTTKSTTSFTPW